MKNIVPSFLFLLFLLTFPLFAEKPALPSKVIPDGLGYNIHFTDARPGEMEMIAESGAAIIRMDFGWQGTEREKGKYDFSAFERLTDSLEKHKIRPLYILDYSNRHYDEGLSPYSDEGRKAFAAWATAAAVHFKGRGILWEMWNEPNINQFWKPKVHADDYIKLALEVGKALREAAPDELYIGPATSEIDFGFLEQCFKGGLLEYWDAVSVHPYRQSAPETVIEEYAKLCYMIGKYAPKDKKIPILSGEWGYSSAWGNYNDDLQGKMLPRQWMINLACAIPVSIWYDWHDDGTDPREPEHHFGTVNYPYKRDQTPVYDPKPAYLAAKTFTEMFRGFQYNKRISNGDPDVYVFLFDDGQNVKLAAWTTSKEQKTITIPSSPGKFTAVSYLGDKRFEITADKEGLKLTVSDGPVYLIPDNSDGFWSDVAKLESLPLARYNEQLGVERVISFMTTDSSMAISTESVQDQPIKQFTGTLIANPIVLGMPIPIRNTLVLPVDNPSGEAFPQANLVIGGIEGFELSERIRPLELKQGETSTFISFPLETNPSGTYALVVGLNRNNSTYFPLVLGDVRHVDDFSKYTTESQNAAWGIFPDGDRNVGSEQKIEMAEGGLVKITYKFNDGWKFIRLAPKEEALRTIEGEPKKLCVCVEGDGSGNSVRLRFADAKGQTFQIHGGTMSEKKLYSFAFPLDGRKASHWGGPNDGKITYPIRFDSLLIDGTRSATGPHSVVISPMVLVY